MGSVCFETNIARLSVWCCALWQELSHTAGPAGLGPPGVAFKCTEPWTHVGGTQLALLVGHGKPKASHLPHGFRQLLLDKYPIKHLNL